MTTTSTAHRPAASADTPALIDLVAAVRQVIGMRADWARTAHLVADRLRAHLPGPGILTGVLAGTEHEELFDESLNPVGVRDNHSGEVSGFAPPGDIHRIRNDGSETAISLHIYGTDITRIGSSARRNYN